LFSESVGGDSGTGDICHVWRLPETLNHPGHTKLGRGRPPEPQPVELIGGTGELIDPDKLRAALEAMPDRKPATNGEGNGNGHRNHDEIDRLMRRLQRSLREAIASQGDGDRSGHCFKVLMTLFGEGLSESEVLAIATGAPFAAKFRDGRDDLAREVMRVRMRWL
jgi:hypothetical protein